MLHFWFNKTLTLVRCLQRGSSYWNTGQVDWMITVGPFQLFQNYSIFNRNITDVEFRIYSACLLCNLGREGSDYPVLSGKTTVRHQQESKKSQNSQNTTNQTQKNTTKNPKYYTHTHPQTKRNGKWVKWEIISRLRKNSPTSTCCKHH